MRIIWIALEDIAKGEKGKIALVGTLNDALKLIEQAKIKLR
jgi:hypothetical protein